MARSRRIANLQPSIFNTPIGGGGGEDAGTFTSLNVTTGPVQGGGFTALFSSPPAIGGTAPAAGAFTDLSYTGNFFERQAAPANITATGTLTAAQVAGGIITYSGAAAGTLTMPTGSALDALLFMMVVDSAIDFSIISTVAFGATLAGATGVTIVGSVIVANYASGRFRLRKTAASTYVVYRL